MTKPPTVSHVARCYERGLQFNTELGLYDTVTKNENFFIAAPFPTLHHHFSSRIFLIILTVSSRVKFSSVFCMRKLLILLIFEIA